MTDKKSFAEYLTPETRAEALRKASATRAERALVRKNIAAGKLAFSELVARREDPVVGRMKVQQVLLAFPGVGKAKAAKLIEAAGVNPSRRIQGLGSRQIEVLTEALG